MQLSESVRKQVLTFQQTEITEYHIYKRLAKKVNSPENAKIIEQIADDELRHYNGWKKYTNQEVQPRWFLVWFYYFISVAFGFTFGIKLMERGEESCPKELCRVFQATIPEAEKFQHEEDVHEERLINMLDEERLRYAGSDRTGLERRTGGVNRRSRGTDACPAKREIDRPFRSHHRHRRVHVHGGERISFHTL